MVAAYVLVSVEPGNNETVVSTLREMPAVKPYVEVDSDSALAHTVLTQIQGIAGVRDTETHIVVPL